MNERKSCPLTCSKVEKALNSPNACFYFYKDGILGPAEAQEPEVVSLWGVINLCLTAHAYHKLSYSRVALADTYLSVPRNLSSVPLPPPAQLAAKLRIATDSHLFVALPNTRSSSSISGTDNLIGAPISSANTADNTMFMPYG
jgi:hypothetical protein